MLSNPRKQKNQSCLGATISQRRKALGMTQRQLADKLGLSYYTMISQLERGYISIPPTLWRPIAEALEIEPEDWVTLCLSENYPEVYTALFGRLSKSHSATALRNAHDQMSNRRAGN